MIYEEGVCRNIIIDIQYVCKDITFHEAKPIAELILKHKFQGIQTIIEQLYDNKKLEHKTFCELRIEMNTEENSLIKKLKEIKPI